MQHLADMLQPELWRLNPSARKRNGDALATLSSAPERKKPRLSFSRMPSAKHLDRASTQVGRASLSSHIISPSLHNCNNTGRTQGGRNPPKLMNENSKIGRKTGIKSGVEKIPPAHALMDPASNYLPAYSPLKNPRKPPEPPVIKFIPPTPAAELERQFVPGPPKRSDSHPQHRLSFKQRARRYSNNFISPFLARASSIRGRHISDPPADHRQAKIHTVNDEEDGSLHPFWRPRGFWDGFEDSDSKDDDILPYDRDTSNAVDNEVTPQSPTKLGILGRKLTSRLKGSGGFLIGNSLDVERAGTNRRRPHIGLPSHRAQTRDSNPRKKTLPSSSEIHEALPPEGMAIRSLVDTFKDRVDTRNTKLFIESVRAVSSFDKKRGWVIPLPSLPALPSDPPADSTEKVSIYSAKKEPVSVPLPPPKSLTSTQSFSNKPQKNKTSDPGMYMSYTISQDLTRDEKSHQKTKLLALQDHQVLAAFCSRRSKAKRNDA